MKILMVCLGNICRSPLAEGILKEKCREKRLDWEIDSAGTSYWHIGELPDSRSIATAKSHGIDITDQRARQLKENDLDYYDLIFAMDHSNYQDILRLSENNQAEDKVYMIMNMAAPESNQPVPDPYWDDNGFERVFEMLSEASDRIIEKYGK